MIGWFRQLAFREQLIVGAGALVAVVIIGWGFVWSPLANGAAELDVAVSEKSRLLVDLRRASSLTASAATGAAGVAPTSSLIVLVDETARPFDLAFTRTSPDGTNAIMITFRDAAFDRLIGWLTQLEQEYGVVIETFSASPTGQPGIVSGTLRLLRS